MAFQFSQTGQELQYLANEVTQLAGDYDETASYAIGDYCNYQGVVYRCTAATTGTFDASAWTNSVIVMDAIKSLKTRMTTAEGEIDAAQEDITALNLSLTWSEDIILTPTLYNCTGTINGSFALRYTDKYACLRGRVRITNFVRTGSNPGVNLPNLPIRSGTSSIGFRAEAPWEGLTLDAGAKRITTTETFSNAANGTLTLMCPITTFPLA